MPIKKRVLAPSHGEARSLASPRKMRAPKKPKAPRPPGSLTPQQKFAKNAGKAWKLMKEAEDNPFGKNYMAFVSKLRSCPGYVDLSPAQLKACVSR